MLPRKTPWLRWLIIILIGNGVYFFLLPYLPAAARHTGFKLDWGTLVDFWFCLIVFGIFELVSFLWGRNRRSQKTENRS